MGSTPHAVRRGTALRVVDETDAALAHGVDRERDPPAHPGDAARRRLGIRARRPVARLARADRLDSRHPAARRRSRSRRATAANRPRPTSPTGSSRRSSRPCRPAHPGATTSSSRRSRARPARSQHFLVRARQVREDGQIVGCAGLVVDISDRHLVEANLRELIDRYRRLVDLSPDGIVVHQGGGRLREPRRTRLRRRPTTVDEVLGRSIIDFVHPDSLGPTLERIAQLSDDVPVSEPAEATLMRLDGAPWLVESVSVLTRWEGEDAYQVILRDLTDRKRAEAALRYQANLVEHVSDAIIGVDTDGRVESWNHAAELIYGVTSDDAVGSALHDLVGLPAGFGETPMRDVESVHRRHDGKLVIVRASVTDIFDEGGNQTGFGRRVRRHHRTPARRGRTPRGRAVAQHGHRSGRRGHRRRRRGRDRRRRQPRRAPHPPARRSRSASRLIDCITGPDGVVGADRRPVVDRRPSRRPRPGPQRGDARRAHRARDRRHGTLALAELPPAARDLGRGRGHRVLVRRRDQGDPRPAGAELPGHARRAHRPVQPHGVRRQPAARARTRSPHADEHRGAVHRPRPVQARQRHARARER